MRLGKLILYDSALLPVSMVTIACVCICCWCTHTSCACQRWSLTFLFICTHIQRKSVSRTKWTLKAKRADVGLRVDCQSMLFSWKLCSSNNPWNSSPAHSSRSHRDNYGVKAAGCFQELGRLRERSYAMKMTKFHSPLKLVSPENWQNDVLSTF